MTATHPPFALFVGDTWRFDCALHDANGAALDLTGAAVAWTLRDAGGTARTTLTVGKGVTITNAAGGLCVVEMPKEQTALLAPGAYADQIRVTLANGLACTQAVGPIIVATGAPVRSDPAAQLAALKSARRSGLRRLRIENVETEYRDDAELAAEIAALEAEIAGTPPVRTVYLRSKGWS